MAKAQAADIKPGIWRHFEGNLYEVIGIATHTETQEKMVVYRPARLYYSDHEFLIRPLSMFTERVDRDGYLGPRFTFVIAI
ncbi:MAG: DUF1653 domain-containing protein [bacterium]|nr:DUF1653 domain-containing protein [bacterium]